MRDGRGCGLVGGNAVSERDVRGGGNGRADDVSERFVRGGGIVWPCILKKYRRFLPL